MKRKTNLFYTSGVDSKFLTFSNYTEALTGNFLSTNIKLFPNSFLCLNIPNLTNSEKLNFIKNVLVAAYENKLAVLRDANITDIDELAILIDYIHTYVNTNEPVLIVYKGEITEQDFNGTFTDLICTIDSSKLKSVSYDLTGGAGEKAIKDETPDKLHGWYNDDNTYTGPNAYKNIKPIYDSINADDKFYNYDNSISIDIDDDSQPDSVVFNIIIPLFNVVNADTNDYVVLKENSPLGIWFADRNIELTTDGLYGQTWSLAIGSQFKPLPTMQNNYSDVSGNNSSALEYSTFAQILARQNGLLKSYQDLIVTVNNLTNRIQELEKQIDTTDI